MTEQSKILVVEDDQSLREAIYETLRLSGFDAVTVSNGEDALALLERQKVSLVLSDVQMPEMDGNELLKRVRAVRSDLPFVLMTAFGSIEKAVEAIQEGATDYLVKPFDSEVFLELIGRFCGSTPADKGLVAEDPVMLNALRLAARVAPSDATVMISGESGSGKEVIARFIHNNSPRHNHPFVALNCAAIPETMLESLLFGYEKGAFTGAIKSCGGKFEQANHGTLLLDEISEMDISLQAKLLRVLQEKEVERLGGSAAIPLDVRVLATTNRNLREQVAEGKFREDLFYRLNVFPLHVPSLKDRLHDVLPLADYFARNYAEGKCFEFSEDARRALMLHAWPGNVRELENVIRRALILRAGKTITASDITFEMEPAKVDQIVEETITAVESSPSSLENDLCIKEQYLILDALRAENGNKQCAAERLGISPRTLRYKIAKFRKEGVCIPELASA